ncbi:STAS domain-containing protein [Actinoplanes sp. NPDC023936]|uniref:STAS domain-containing protein n=1 Tax=Actinoplanes sp. NPDC023936 TaxID=3154910 RepID=UPI0033C87FF1
MAPDTFLDGTPLTVEVRSSTSSPRTVVVSAAGEIDRDSCERLRRAVGDALHRDQPRLISLDLGAVTFLDSAGIRALLNCRRDAGDFGCELEIGRAHDHVYQVLAITGLVDVFALGEKVVPRS